MALSGVWPGWAYLAWLGGGLVVVYGAWATVLITRGVYTAAGSRRSLVPAKQSAERKDMFILPIGMITAAYILLISGWN